MSEVSETHKKDEGGRPPHVPTEEKRKKVKSYAAIGIPQLDIASVMKMSINTLRKHYASELDTGSIEANATIGGALYKKALSGDTGCLIWWTKARMKWSEKTEIDHTVTQLEVAGDLMYKKPKE